MSEKAVFYIVNGKAVDANGNEVEQPKEKVEQAPEGTQEAPQQPETQEPTNDAEKQVERPTKARIMPSDKK